METNNLSSNNNITTNTNNTVISEKKVEKLNKTVSDRFLVKSLSIHCFYKNMNY